MPVTTCWSLKDMMACLTAKNKRSAFSVVTGLLSRKALTMQHAKVRYAVTRKAHVT